MLKKALTGLGGTSVCLLLYSMAAGAASDEIILYSSDAATLSGQWTRAAEVTAAGGQMLTTPDAGWASTGAPLAAPVNFAEWTFDAPANTPYRVWLRLRAAANSKYNDSVYVQFSDAVDATGAALFRIGTTDGLDVNLQSCNGCPLSGWGWLNSAYWLQQVSTVTFAGAGAHTLRIQTREDGVQLDQVVLSSVAYATQPPGPVMNDATIIAKPAVPVPTPFTGIAAAVPGTIEAEDFDNGGEGLASHDTSAGNSGTAYRQTDVDIEASSEGAYNVGWVSTGEWLIYSVKVAAPGSYLLEARVASQGQGGTFHVEVGGTNVTGALTIPNTGGWQAWTTLSKTVALVAGPQLMKVVFDTTGPNAVGNVNWIRFTRLTPTPYTGSFIAIPTIFQSADFDNGGEGIAYHDTTTENSGGRYRSTGVDLEMSSLGGVDVGWIASGEWLSYCVNVVVAGNYTITVQVASPYSTGQLHARFGATDLPAVAVPNTGGWQNWTTVTMTAPLSAGNQLMKLIFDNGGFNVAGVTATYVPPAPPPTTTFNILAGGDFQTALDAAKAGDTILLQAGATFIGNFVLPAKTGDAVITIRSSAPDSALPADGIRITPAYADALPKLKSPNGMAALLTAPGAHHYRLQCLEFLANAQGSGDQLDLGDGSAAQNSLALVPHDLIVDRVYLHGDPVYGQKRAIGLNSASTTIQHSYVSEIKAVGQDSQAIANWNGPGPYAITNNYLEAAGENIIFGGDDPKIIGLIASDITITRNYLTKQLAWRAQPGWNVKNLLELKNAQRVVIDGNLLEYNWLAAQSGYAILFTPRNQYGGAPWTIVRDVQFTNNLVRHVASGINLLGHDNLNLSQETTNIQIRNNVFEDVSSTSWGGAGRFLLINGGRDITVDHNTVIQNGYSAVFADTNPTLGFTLTNNIMPDYSWVIIGASMAPGNSTIAYYFPNSTILNGIYASAPPSRYPTGNYYPATMAEVGFTDLAGGNYKLSPTSSYRAAATDGKDVGADIDAITTARQ